MFIFLYVFFTFSKKLPSAPQPCLPRRKKKLPKKKPEGGTRNDQAQRWPRRRSPAQA